MCPLDVFVKTTATQDLIHIAVVVLFKLFYKITMLSGYVGTGIYFEFSLSTATISAFTLSQLLQHPRICICFN